MLGPRDRVFYLLGLIVPAPLHGRSSFSSTGSLALAAPAAPTADFGWLTTDEPEWLPRNLTATGWAPAGNEKEERPQPTVKSEKSAILTQDNDNGKAEPGDEQAQSAAHGLDEAETPAGELEAGEQGDAIKPDAAKHNGIALQGHNKAVIGCHWVGDVRNCLGKAKPPPTHYDLCRCPWFRGCLKKLLKELKKLKKLNKLNKLGRPPKGVAPKEKADLEVKVGRDE